MRTDSATPRGLLDVREFRIPRRVLDPTLEHLGDAGRRRREAFVAWGGVIVGGRTLEFRSVHRPDQHADATPHGLLVAVDGAALHRLNAAVYGRGEILAGQVHTHPGEAYHSSTDDHFPIVTILGALSLVVPDFARAGRAASGRWAWYRLAGYGRWTRAGAETLLVVEP